MVMTQMTKKQKKMTTNKKKTAKKIEHDYEALKGE